MTTGSPRPKVAYQILMPLTGAKPDCTALGKIGVGGRVSHCGAACAAAPEANRMAAAKRLRTVDIPFSRLKMSFHSSERSTKVKHIAVFVGELERVKEWPWA